MSGPLAVQRLIDGQWQTLKTLHASGGLPLAVSVPMRGTGSLRAVVGGTASYAYEQRR